jgi:hypothetical protein
MVGLYPVPLYTATEEHTSRTAQHNEMEGKIPDVFEASTVTSCPGSRRNPQAFVGASSPTSSVLLMSTTNTVYLKYTVY